MNLFCIRISIFGCALLTVGVMECAADAQIANLSCSGMFHIYEPEADRLDATFPPAASIVDLTNRKIVTPLGTYRIASIEENEITFDKPASPSFNFVTHGSMDRLTGKLLMRW